MTNRVRRSRYACSLFLLLSSLQAFSQEPVSGRWGVKAGYLASRFVEQNFSNQFLSAYAVGALYQQPINVRMAFRGELLYTRSGNINTYASLGSYMKEVDRYDYVVLPLSLRYRLPALPLAVTPGVQFGYLVTEQTQYTPAVGTVYRTYRVNKWDAGLKAGIEYPISQHIFIEFTYYKGFTNAVKIATALDPQTGQPLPIQLNRRFNEVLGLNVGYFF